MPERFSPDQLFAWVAHWRGLLNEDQLLDLEDQYEQILDEGDYVSLAELAVRGGFIKEAQRDGLQRWYRLAEERFDGTWYARQLMEDGVPQAEIDAAFARQEKQFVTDKRIVPLLDILIQRSVITPGMAADLEPPPEELDDEGDDSDSGEHYDDGAAPSDVAVSNWSETQMHRAAGGLLDMVMSATEQESPTRIRRRAAEELGLEPDDADEDEEVPDLLKMQEQMRSEPAGPAKVTPSGRVVAAPPPVVLPGGDDRSLTAALAQLKIGGTPDPGSTKGIPFGEKFELYREIRRERSGIFYLARQTNLGRLVVVRLLTEELSRLPGVPERYRELATAAGRLAHPHLAQVFEVGVGNDGRPFSVLEYLPGQPLSEVLRRGQRIGVRHAVQLILSIAKALDEASKQNLLHGDLSLADLFLASDGQIKVRLPGYVDLWPAEQRAARRDPFCTAPELDTEPDATPQSDMYALGVCFYTVLTQRL
ncbi:MAG: protein kinase, partial [Planctomycetota bacterium]